MLGPSKHLAQPYKRSLNWNPNKLIIFINFLQEFVFICKYSKQGFKQYLCVGTSLKWRMRCMFLSIYVHFGNLEINRSKYFPFNRINFYTAAEVEKHLSS